MRPPFFVCMAVAVTTSLLALGAASAHAGTAAQLRGAAPSAAAETAAGKISVRYTIERFAPRGRGLVAYGTAIAKYTPASGGVATTSTKPFRAAVKIRTRRLASVQTICPILTLDLQQLDLNLLGLVVHADRVFLTLKANSEGGLLGKLLCGLSNSGKLTQQATRLNWTAKKSGLAVTGTGFTVAVPSSEGAGSASTGGAGPSAVTPLAICPVLELTLGPLDADLLGLLVHLDQVHLTITADSEGGILGSLFCSVAGGGTTT